MSTQAAAVAATATAAAAAKTTKRASGTGDGGGGGSSGGKKVKAVVASVGESPAEVAAAVAQCRLALFINLWCAFNQHEQLFIL